MEKIKVGNIVLIDGYHIKIKIDKELKVDRLASFGDVKEYLIEVNKLLYSTLIDQRKIILKTVNIYCDEGKNIYAEARFIGIYEPSEKKFDRGINSFPVIMSPVYYLLESDYNEISSQFSNLLMIGNSFSFQNVKIYADINILLGKHLSVFGNTGTGKSCTIASILQSIGGNVDLNEKVKIIIFDPNSEYKIACESVFKDKITLIEKGTLKLPHSILSESEYVRLFDASSGVQAPILIDAIRSLKGSGKHFDINALYDKIQSIVKTKGNDYTQNQYQGWVNTMQGRIKSRFVENEELMNILNSESNNVAEFISSNNKLAIIEGDYDKYELDIIVYLLCKYLYQIKIDKFETKHLIVVFEEAHRYINNDETQEYKLGNYYIERLAREGRKFVISLIISSQRPSELSHVITSQCNSVILHRLTNKYDLEYIAKSVPLEYSDLIKIVQGLEKQYALVTGEAFKFPEIVKINKAHPLPNSDDPKII